MFKHPADVIQALMSTNSRLDKEAIVQAAWDQGITEFFVGSALALDALTTFGVQKVPMIEDDAVTGTFVWSDFATLASQLSSRTLTGHAARDALRSAAEQATAREWNLWYRRLLLKDLKCGTSESTINKVLAKNGAAARPYMVPVFSCQLAKPADDHPRKMRGVKMLDRKFDGVRLLTVLDKYTQTVTQFTRNGIVNTNFSHICNMLSALLPLITESVVLDGELVSANFQALMTQVNRKNNVDTSDSKLILFDIIPLSAFRSGEYKVAQQDRHTALCELIPHLSSITQGVVEVEPKLIVDLDTEQGKQTFREFNRSALDAKLEGIMVKDPQASYKTKRSDAWLKQKPFQTFDLRIVAIEEGQGKFEGVMGALICEGTDDGKFIRVNVGSGFDDGQRKDIWDKRSQMIGQVVEIKTDIVTKSADSDNVYSLRFPVFVRFRSIAMTPGSKD